MTNRSIPTPEKLTICFAHVAYHLELIFASRQTNLRNFQVWTAADLAARLPEADVLVISGLWQNDLLDCAPRLRFIQSIGAGIEQFDLDALRQRGIRLATASGVNSNAVSEHAMALVLALARHIHTGRDRQNRREWRGMIGDLSLREDELGGKTLLIVGPGKIGGRLARLAKAFDMRVLATKRNPAAVAGVDAVHPPGALPALLPQADFVALTCPLINVARGGCVDEPALLAALESGTIAGAGIDHFWDEPLPQDSPFWALENLLITPHSGGETRMYEENLLDILLENLGRLWRGETELVNQVV